MTDPDPLAGAPAPAGPFAPPVPADRLPPTLPAAVSPTLTRRPAPTRPQPDAADRLLARLADPAPLPRFDPAPLPPRGDRSPAEAHAAAAAVGCPDAFLIDAPPGPARAAFLADLTAAAADAGRVFVLAPPAAADRVVELLAERFPGLSLARAVSPTEPTDRLSPPAAARTASARRAAEHARYAAEARAAALSAVLPVLAEFRDAAGAFLATEPAPAPEADADTLSARHAEAVARFDAERGAAEAAEAAARAEANGLRAELDAATEEAKRGHGIVGFVRGLISKTDPAGRLDELQHRLAAAEQAARDHAEKLAEIAAARAAAEQAHRDAVAAAESLADRAARRAASERSMRGLAARLADAGFPPPEPPTPDALARFAESVESAHRDAEIARSAAPDDAPPRVVVGPPDAVGADPLLPAEPGFDRLIVLDADGLPEPAFQSAARLAGRWVFVGDSRPHPLRNGRSPRPGLFARLWAARHRPAWVLEDGRLVARLADVPRRDRVRIEPLADRPDIELRFVADAGTAQLAEVAFPPGAAAADARAFLAAELGEVRLSPCGPVRWHDEDDRLTACWPAAEMRAGTWIELGGGVRERVVGTGPDAVTASVSFDRSAGWDRGAAERWLAEHAADAHAARTACLRGDANPSRPPAAGG